MMTLEEAFEFGRQGMGIEMFRREVKIRADRERLVAELEARIEDSQRELGNLDAWDLPRFFVKIRYMDEWGVVRSDKRYTFSSTVPLDIDDEVLLPATQRWHHGPQHGIVTELLNSEDITGSVSQIIGLR